MKHIFTLACAAMAVIATPAASQKIEKAPFYFASELAAKGFEPFALGDVAKTLFGMRQGAEIYMCFYADNERLRKERADVIEKVFKDPNHPRDIPAIPVVCAPVQ